jgi:hypothetical protein
MPQSSRAASGAGTGQELHTNYLPQIGTPGVASASPGTAAQDAQKIVIDDVTAGDINPTTVVVNDLANQALNSQSPRAVFGNTGPSASGGGGVSTGGVAGAPGPQTTKPQVQVSPSTYMSAQVATGNQFQGFTSAGGTQTANNPALYVNPPGVPAGAAVGIKFSNPA